MSILKNIKLHSSSRGSGSGIFLEGEFDLLPDAAQERFVGELGLPSNSACPIGTASRVGSKENEELKVSVSCEQA